MGKIGIGGGLGKDFGQLLKEKEGKQRVREIPLAEIIPNRYQPRKDFDEAALEELKESIVLHGVLQPILLRKVGEGKYEIIAGERRMRAAKLAGLEKIPAILREYNDREMSEIALVENLAREDLNAMEEANAYDQLMKDFSLTQEEIAKRTGRSRSYVANFLRLLKLAPEVQAYVANGSLSMGQAKPLLAIENEKDQKAAAEIILEKELTARGAEALVKKILQEGRKESAPKQEKDVHVKAEENRLAQHFGTQVRIIEGKKKSSIQIDYYSLEDFERILELLGMGEQEVQTKKTIDNFVV